MATVSLSVVIPVYNEAPNLRPLFHQLQRALDDWPGGAEFIFIDDGSKDQTLDNLMQIQAEDPRLRIVRFRRNFGQTAAMAAGFRLARGNAVVTLDGDLQNDPADIPLLVEQLRDWDVVCGVRVRRRDSGWKKLTSRIANGFRNWATGDNITDTGCTLKAYRRECLSGLELYRGMHRFLPTLLKMRGCRVTQVEVGHHPRLHGKTNYGTWGRMVKGLADVYAVRWMKSNRIDFEAEMEVMDKPGHGSAETGHSVVNRVGV